MERINVICKDATLEDVAKKLTNFLEINCFEVLKPKPQLEKYKCTKNKNAFNIILDFEGHVIQASFEYREGNHDYFVKKVKDIERILTAEQELSALETMFIYYSQ
jgi:hypothetical protein